MSEDNLFYVVSPKDVVVARQRDQDDHISWLLQHDKFEVLLGQLKKICVVQVSLPTLIFSSPGRSPGRAVVLPRASALVVASALAAASMLAKC